MKREIPNIFKGTAILVLGGFAVKALGAFYRIYLSRLIGAEGIGLYQMVYPFYLMFLSLATAGIPVAVSRLVAEHGSRGDESAVLATLRIASTLMLLLGGTVTIVLFWGAPWLASHLMTDYRVVYTIKALAPSIVVLSLSGVWRGYFQGRFLMLPSALSQLIEQFVRVGVSLILVFCLLSRGVEHAAAGAAFGSFAGGFAGLIYLWINYYKERLQWLEKRRKISNIAHLKSLLRFALPIAAMAILTPLLQALDSLLVPRSLRQIGYSVSEATSLLGVLGNAWAVLYLPLIVTGALDANLLPRLTALQQSNDQKLIAATIHSGLRLTLLYLFPIAVGLACFGEIIYKLLYGVDNVLVLAQFAAVISFLGLEQISSGILQALGKPNWPLQSFCVGAILKIPLTLFFCMIPQLNISGAIPATFCGVLLTVLLNFRRIGQLTKLPSLRVMPLLGAAFGMLVICRAVVKNFAEQGWICLCFGGMLGVGIYLFLTILLKGITIKDIEVFRKTVKERS